MTILCALVAGHAVGATMTESCFILGIQFPFQQRMMLQFGQGRVISMDATFGTNKMGVRIISQISYKQCYSKY
jgi:hypothetical protein